jgi:hypothetical protein
LGVAISIEDLDGEGFLLKWKDNSYFMHDY